MSKREAIGPGRPARVPLEVQRTHLWAQSVCIAAGLPLRELEGVLGADGKWDGVWSRYSRGAVSPSPDRVARIASAFPGTERYYFCPFWDLVAERHISWQHLRAAVEWLAPLFRQPLLKENAPVDALFWMTSEPRASLLAEATRLLPDQKFGLDALTVILILIREAEIIQSGDQYLCAMVAWAKLERLRARHLVLRRLSSRVLDYVAEPMRTIRFASVETDTMWQEHLHWYCNKKAETVETFEVIDALNESAFELLD